MRRRKNNNIVTIAAYGCVLVACIGIVAYMGFQAYGKPVADKLGCYPEFPQSHILVLVDSSDPRFDRSQQLSLKNYFVKTYEELGFNERLSFYTTEAKQISSVPRSSFHICGTGTKQELEAHGIEAGSLGYLAKQRQRLFDKAFKPELEALLSLNPDESRRQRGQSPILEMIKSLSHSNEMKPGGRLIIVSDLLQASESAQFCVVKNHLPKFSVFERRNIYQSRLKPNSLQGVDVEILMLQRHGYGSGVLRFCRDEEELKTFWRDYLIGNGVVNPRIIRIRQAIGENSNG